MHVGSPDHGEFCFFQVAKMVETVRAKGGNVTREPGPVKGGSSVIAFVKDPDGYTFELIQRGPTPEPLCQVMLRVGDLDRAINFYEKVSARAVVNGCVYVFEHCCFLESFYISLLKNPAGPRDETLEEDWETWIQGELISGAM